MRDLGPGRDLFAGFHLPQLLAQSGLGWLEAVSRRVRIHTDEPAHRRASAAGADAVTQGREIFFAAHKFDPITPRGIALISHELAHVRRQEQDGQLLRPERQAASEAGLEREALGVERSVYRVLTQGDSETAADRSNVSGDLAPTAMHLAIPSVAIPGRWGDSSNAPDQVSTVAQPAPTALALRAASGRDVETADAAAVDATEVAAQVYRILERRLRIDKERLGIGRE